MKYVQLNKLFYSDRTNYESIFQQRYNSDDAIRIDFPFLSPTCFCLQNREISNLLIAIYRIDTRIRVLKTVLPKIAISHFTKRCLIDEIMLTNDIEGVNSTRQDISNVLNELETKNRRQRFYGLVRKYEMLDHPSSISSCEDIRAIYNDLVLNEVAEEDPHDLPDGQLFRANSVSVYPIASNNSANFWV